MLYHHPCSTFVAGFIGSPKMNLLEAELVLGDADGATVRLSPGVEVRVAVDASGNVSGGKVILGIRPEHAVVGEGDGAVLEGRVVYTERLGDRSLLYLDIPGSGELLTVQVSPDTQVVEGEALRVELPADACHLFDEDGLAFRRLLSPACVQHPRAGPT